MRASRTFGPGPLTKTHSNIPFPAPAIQSWIPMSSCTKILGRVKLSTSTLIASRDPVSRLPQVRVRHSQQTVAGNHVSNGAHQRNAAVRSSSEETVAPEACGGLEILGRGVKELVQAVQNLRHIGIEDLNLPLPKIVVVGDQSTGKSSLIEGIRSVDPVASCHLIYSTANKVLSGIKVPRKLGVCTRVRILAHADLRVGRLTHLISVLLTLT